MKPLYSDYSVLPRLTKLKDYPPEGVFKADDQYNHFVDEKWKALGSSDQQPICYANQMPKSIVCDVIDQICEWKNLPWMPAPTLCRQIQEDIAIFCLDGEQDYLGYTNICFPSDWLPEDKIGKSFEEIHKPVPGFKSNPKIVQAMIYSGPFERWVWSPVYDPWEEQKINYHPSLPKASFDPANPHVHLKIERQTIYGFPTLGAALFTMRQKLVPFEEIELDKLATACENMSKAERKYKGITKPFLRWIFKNV